MPSTTLIPNALSEDVPLWSVPPSACTSTCGLYLTEEIAGFHEWDHLQTVARVTYEKHHRGTGEIIEKDERYYISSLVAGRFTPKEWMRSIRGHWAVENNCHFIWDAISREDTRPWIERDPRGTVVMLTCPPSLAHS